LFVDASGNVGVGAISDVGASKLFIAGNGTAGLTNIVTIRTVSANSYGLQIKGNNTNNEWSIQNYYNAALAFGTNNTERLRIAADGKLGLGTSSPLYSLDCRGIVASVAGTGSTPAMYLYGLNSSVTSSTIFGQFTDDTNTAQWSGSKIVFNRTGNWTSSISLFTSPDFTNRGGVERLTITDTGRVGINTTSPAYPLVVASAAASTLQILSGGTTNLSRLFFGDDNDLARGFINYDHSDDSMRLGSNDTERARIDSSGRLLVGTSNARGPLLQITEALGLQHAAMRTYAGTGDLTINLGGLRPLNSSGHRQAGGVIIYSGIQGNSSNITSLVCFFRVNGLSTYNSVTVTNIVGTTTLTLSDAGTSSCTLTLDVGDSVEGSALVFLTSQSGGDLT
jgi:hypothetical protein